MPDRLLDLEVYRLLRRIHTRTRRKLHTHFAEHGLTGAQFWTLARVPDAGIPLTALAAQADADPANISGIVDRLVREGLLERRPDGRDRRVSLICLTGAGRQRLAEMAPRYQDAVADALSPLDPEQKEQLRGLLRTLLGGRAAEPASVEAGRLAALAAGSAQDDDPAPETQTGGL